MDSKRGSYGSGVVSARQRCVQNQRAMTSVPTYFELWLVVGDYDVGVSPYTLGRWSFGFVFFWYVGMTGQSEAGEVSA